MPIQYALSKTNVTTDPENYAATVQRSGSADAYATGDRCGSPMVRDMIDQRSTVNEPDILVVGV